jgi:hypothetical protein
MNALRASVLALLALSFTGAVLAKQPEGKGKPDGGTQAAAPAKSGGGKSGGSNAHASGGSGGSGHGKEWRDDDRDGRVDIDAGFLQGFIRDNHYDTGYKPLPPGIQKNLARGKPIPPGLQARAVPGALLQQLPYRSGYEWRSYGTNLVLVQVATGLVEEILEGIFD